MLKLYSEIHQAKINWLWYPYIAYGKITILQGNPGNGKSHIGIQLAAVLSSCGELPNGTRLEKEEKVIYQCAEDGLSDTIKPRLVQAGADCHNIAFIDDDYLTLDDETLRSSIESFKAKLVIIDPFQAYLGSSDLSSASAIRRIMNRISKWANLYDCAVLLIGHLNKNEGAKDLYRGLGSIDVAAVARSILQVEIDESNPNMRIIHQIKNSLAPKGADVCFSIISGTGIQWLRDSETLQSQTSVTTVIDKDRSKQEVIADMLRQTLQNGPVAVTEIMEKCEKLEIGKKTLEIVKKAMHIQSLRKDGQWFWQMPEECDV